MGLLQADVADHVAAGREPACSGGNDVCAHSLYVEAGPADQAAEFVGDRLQATQ
jgi:hypothetical protein